MEVTPVVPFIEVIARPTSAERNRWDVSFVIGKNAPPGPFSRTFHLVTEIQPPPPPLYVVGTICTPVELEPRTGLNFGVLTRGEARGRSGEIRVVCREEGDVLSLGDFRVTALNENSQVEIVPSTKKSVEESIVITPVGDVTGKVVNLYVAAKDTMPPGLFCVKIMFKTGVDRLPELHTTIRGYVRQTPPFARPGKLVATYFLFFRPPSPQPQLPHHPPRRQHAQS